MYLAQGHIIQKQLAKHTRMAVTSVENVGGPVFDAVCGLLNPNARISLCGSRPLWRGHRCIVRDGSRRRAAPRIHGLEVHPLFVGDFVASHQAKFLEEMGDHVRSGGWSIRRIESKALPKPARFDRC